MYAVNPQGRHLEGVRCVPSAADLPEPSDVAVIAVPAGAVAEVAGVRRPRRARLWSVITAGLGAARARAAGHLPAVRHAAGRPELLRHRGARPRAERHVRCEPAPARGAGLVVQSGGIGIALLEHLSRLGIGVSSFASVGDKYDVSSNDLLTWWEQDGGPGWRCCTWSRSAARASSPGPRAGSAGRCPVLTVIGGRSAAGPAGRRVAHGRRRATPLVTQEALFGQAGIIATRSLGELIEAAALLGCQPLRPAAGSAIVSNAGGAGVLAADACADNGLAVAPLGEATQERLRGLLPAGAAVAGPVDTTRA